MSMDVSRATTNRFFNGTPIATVRYHARHGLDVFSPGVDTLDFTQLRQRGSRDHLAAVQRLEFLMFALYTSGSGVHMVDFQCHPVQANTLVVVQPGQLHQFRLGDDLQGQLLAVNPQFMLPDRLAYLKSLLSGKPWPVCSQLTPQKADEFLEICKQLQADASRDARSDLLGALARQRLYTLLLLLKIHWETGESNARADTTAMHLALEFQTLLELHFLQRWTVQDYARRLGYAERTLTRACLAYFGDTAKALLDARLLLEIKRLLAHSADSVESISLQMGFDDPSPMVRFFRRLQGTTPQAFRQSLVGSYGER